MKANRALIICLAAILTVAAFCVCLLSCSVGSPAFSRGLTDALLLLPALGIAAVIILAQFRFHQH